MKPTSFLATTALLAGMGLATLAQAQQTMYRCGNKYQDKPCDDGQKGRVVGTTGAPAPAAAKDRPVAPQAGSRSQAESEELALQDKARECLRVRQQIRDTKQKYSRAKEMYESDLRRLGCAETDDGGLAKERQCAAASSQERSQACKPYAQMK